MDSDLMDRWVASAFGVDAETYREVLAELQLLRSERSELESQVWKLEDEVTAHIEFRETIKGLVHTLEKAA